MATENPTHGRRVKHRSLLLGACGVGIIAVALSLWFARISIAEFAVRQVCNSRGLNCLLTIDRLTLSEIELSQIELSAESADSVTVDGMDLSLTWPAFLSPEITYIRADRPALTIDARGGEVRVSLLEALEADDSASSSDSSSGMEIPPFALVDGHVRVLTDAGPVNGVVSSSGSLQREIRTSIALQPASLELDDNSLELTAGQADLVLAQGRISGNIEVDLDRAALETLDISDVSLNATITPRSDNAYEASWVFAADRLVSPSQSVTGFDTRGDVSFELDGGEISIDALIMNAVQASLQFVTLRSGNISASDGEVQFTLDTLDDDLQGEFSVISGLNLEGLAASERVVLTGQLATARRDFLQSSAEAHGVLSVTGAKLDEAFQDVLLASLSLPDPLSTHADALDRSLRHLLGDFSTGLEFNTTLDMLPLDFELTSIRPASIQSENRNEIFRVQALGDANWLELTPEGLTLRGLARYSDSRRGIDLQMDDFYLSQNAADGVLSMRAGRTHLTEMQVDDRALEIDFSQLTYEANSAQNTLTAIGGLRYSGPAFGADFSAAQVQMELQGLNSGAGWSFRFLRDTCLDLSFMALESASIVFGPANVELCGADDQVFSQAEGITRGEFFAEELVLPFEADFGRGEIALVAPAIEWAVRNSFVASVSSEQFALPFEILGNGTTRQFDFASETFTGSLESLDDGVALDFALIDGAVVLEDLPVAIAIAELRGDGLSGSQGIAIDYSLLGAQFSDSENSPENALYQPLMLSGTGHLTGTDVDLQGRLRLAERNAFIGDVVVQHRIAENAGELSLSGGQLDFERGALQLHHLSEQLRGIAVNATGAIIPEAQVNWRGDEMNSTGVIDIQGLSFDTFRLGSLQGLSGQLAFTDLIGLKTEEGQRLELEAFQFTPTIVLENGVAEIALLGPSAFQLESATFPFIGGEIGIEPTIWRFDSDSQLLTIDARNWDLSRLLNLFELSDLDISGVASGSFPIEIVGPDAFFRDAYLNSIEGGRIRYRGDVGESAGSANEYAEMAFQALRNFQYEVLALGANGNLAGNIVLDLRMSGQSPEVLDGQEFVFNISIDSELAELVHAGSISTSVQSTQDMIIDLLQEQRETEQND
ncbi:MAG: hypothetical protein CBB65_08675 [Hyphomonadaceae bacterium TMED5]|nr:hypothetical protein [Ponticaulis sp.]OUY00193.1 MAG: hypothetical protein CBB65_08675 [Hyphomonadaceae bacterium TMED5]|tara:strand:+ start:124432 stop:127779 length:3348 start_codon:yes stop_codon:yes gene_type:complete